MNKIFLFTLLFLSFCLINSDLFSQSSKSNHQSMHAPSFRYELSLSQKVQSDTDFKNLTELESFIDRKMEIQLDEYKIPGAAVAIAKNDSFMFSKGYGLADKVQGLPVQANQTIFRMASVSKLFTWTAVMQLWDAGKIDLEADINSYLSTFKIPTPFSKSITMKHLMSHTAGFEDLAIRMRARTQNQLLDLEEFCKNNIPECIYPPGEISAYSNYGVTLAGYIVQEISGIPFREYIKQKIFEPLGMVSSTFNQPLPSNMSSNLAVGYSGIKDDGTYDIGKFVYFNVEPAAGMSSTASDIAKFMIAHLQNGTYINSSILSTDTTNIMHSHLYSPDPRVNGYSYGWMEMTHNGHRLIWHPGSIDSYHSLVVLSCDQNFGFFVSYNNPAGQDARWDLFNAFMDEYYPLSNSLSPTLQPLPNHKERISKYTGIYRDPRFPYSSCMKALGLVNSVPYNTYPVTRADDGFHLNVFGISFIEVEQFVFYPVFDNGSIRKGDYFLIFLEDYGTKQKTYLVTSQGYMIERLDWFEDPLFHQNIMVICLFSMTCFSLIFLLLAFHEKIQKKKGNYVYRESPFENSFLIWLFEQSTIIMAIITIDILLLNLLFGFLLLTIPEIMTEITWGFSISPIIYLIFTMPLIAFFLVIFFAILFVASWKLKYVNMAKILLCISFLVIYMVSLYELDYWNLLGFQF